MNGGERGIAIVHAKIEYKKFLDDFLRPLEPCLIDGLTEDWIAAKEWVTEKETGQVVPNLTALKETFGEYTGCVTFCDQTDINGETVQKDMKVSEFIELISPLKSEKRYLKDFHFMRVNSSLPKPYTVPKFFKGI